MIFHIGKGKTLRQEDIIGIFDLDNATVSGITRRFLSRATAEKKVSYGDVDIPRSFLLVGEKSPPRGMTHRAKGREKEESSSVKRRREKTKRAEREREVAERPHVFLSHISSLSLLYRAENPLSGTEEE